MISFYEAVAPAAQQPVQQAPGAVVPQVQPQQQPQPAQVPAKPATTAQQPVANAGQTAAVQPAQTQPIQSTEPDWKKYLRNAAWVGAGLGLGGLLYGVGSHWDDIKSHFTPGASVPVPETNEVSETDRDTSRQISARTTTNNIQRRVPEDILRPNRTAGYEGPPPLEHQPLRNGNYREVWPQPGHSPKQLDPYTQRQYYANRGGWWRGSSDDSIYSIDDESSAYGYGARTRPIRQPITDYDLARRSGMGN